MLWKHNKNLLSKKLCTLFTTCDLHVWCLGGPSYQLEFTKIWNFKKWSMI
jgi:hypothetical protein